MIAAGSPEDPSIGIIRPMPDAMQAERIRRFAVLAAVAFLVVLLYRVLEPFIAALAWAVILTLALWPPYRAMRDRIGGPTWLAPTVATATIGLVILVPLTTLGLLLVGEARDLAEHARAWLLGETGDLAGLLRSVPLAGEALEKGLLDWRRDPDELQAVLRQNTETMVSLATRAMANVGRNAFKIVVCIFSAWFLFRHAETLRRQVSDGVRRLGGDRGEALLNRIRITVRATVYGLVMTALVQAILTALGFWIAGASYPLLLGVLMFVFSFIPFGPPLVWGPASISFFFNGEIGWGIATFLWGAAVISSMDNILRPLFIGQATRMPVILVFMGVIGGVTAFGMVGLFVGPVIIAVSLALWEDWIAHQPGLVPKKETG